MNKKGKARTTAAANSASAFATFCFLLPICCFLPLCGDSGKATAKAKENAKTAKNAKLTRRKTTDTDTGLHTEKQILCEDDNKKGKSNDHSSGKFGFSFCYFLFPTSYFLFPTSYFLLPSFLLATSWLLANLGIPCRLIPQVRVRKRKRLARKCVQVAQLKEPVVRQGAQPPLSAKAYP